MAKSKALAGGGLGSQRPISFVWRRRATILGLDQQISAAF
jgi:hypothetical protein